MFIRDDFIDKYVGFVDPGYVMVYLYISRNRKDALSVNKAASALGIQPATLRKALTFWHQQEELSFFIDGDALKIHSIAYSAKSDAPLPDVSCPLFALCHGDLVPADCSIVRKAPYR